MCLAQGLGTINNFLPIFKDRLKYSFVQDWHHRLAESSRATLYREIAIIQFQPYLEIVNIKKFRAALSKLRTSAHRNWRRQVGEATKNKGNRKCDTMEDEFHFIIECPLFSLILFVIKVCSNVYNYCSKNHPVNCKSCLFHF